MQKSTCSGFPKETGRIRRSFERAERSAHGREGCPAINSRKTRKNYHFMQFPENVIEPYRKKNRSVYYHRQFRHVPEVDECMENDQACLYEANVQFNRQLRVDREIVTILTKRLEDCGYHHPNNAEVFCGKELNDLLAAKENFFIKYAELGMRPDVRQAYMKQKHRMIWERRMAEGKKYPLPPL
ncbi:hypothetical protein FSP39_007958 [Pinctada imbricata]|uniref:NADH dehydrogenase [ubiquinone] 1 beta subcomplex subunit 10 n=1 Tax=Pinctada imbricata TaxID=66713 RepID=A0AA88XQN4_PINIB|nr:hypothetical protein FSP39_007958 [Pinctada imbricata]